MAGAGTLVALSGIFCAYAIYSAKWVSAESLGRAFRPLYVLFSRKWYFDELYEGVIVRRGLYRFLSYATDLFDRYIIDGIVDRAGALVSGSGLRGIRRGAAQVISRLETGQVQAYGLGLSLGVLLIVAGFLIFGRYT